MNTLTRRPLTRQAMLLGATCLALLGSYPALADATTSYGAAVMGSPNPQSFGRWGERQASAGADYDADGVSDFFVASPREAVSPDFPFVKGRVRLVSGGTRKVLHVFENPEPQGLGAALFGTYIAVLGDVSLDGLPDIAIGSETDVVNAGVPPVQNQRQGRVYVFSGGGPTQGALLYILDNPFPQSNSRFGTRVARAGDVSGDGVPDVIVGASSNDVCSPACVTSPPPPNKGCGEVIPSDPNCRANQGQAFIFSGSPLDHLASSGLIRTLNLPVEDQGAGAPSFGLAVSSPGDTGTTPAFGGLVSGPLDGVPDQLVDAGQYNGGRGRVYLFSGASGALIRKIDSPDPQAGATFGFQDADFGVRPLAPGSPVDYQLDVSTPQDGYADIYAAAFDHDVFTGIDATTGLPNGAPCGAVEPNGCNEGQGRAWVLDGRTGSVLYQLDDPTPAPGGQFGWSVAATNFRGNDPKPDLYVGQAPHHVPGANGGGGGSYVFKGADGSLLKSLELPSACVQPSSSDNLGPSLGWSLQAPGDLNGDAKPDYIAGAPFYDNTSADGTLNEDQGVEMLFLSGTATPPGLSCDAG